MSALNGFYSLLKPYASTIPASAGANCTVPETLAEAWKSEAPELAEWAWRRLVNRSDAWGAYRAGGGTYTAKDAVTIPRLGTHFNASKVRGLHAIGLDNTSKWLAVDIDAHGEATEAKIAANEAYALELFRRLDALGLKPILESNKRGGYHVWVLFSKPIPSEWAYRAGLALLSDWKAFVPHEPEQFPKRADRNTSGGFGGGWLRIPGRHHKRDEWAKVWDGSTWLEGTTACRFLLSRNGVEPERVPAEWFTYRSQEELDHERRKLEAEQRERERLRNQRHERRPEITSADRYAVAQRILDDHEPAVEGAGGSKVAFRLACLLVQGCDLSAGEAAGMMLHSGWNAACRPAWSESELQHKCDDAAAKPGPRGYMLASKAREALPVVRVEIDNGTTGIGIDEYRRRVSEAVLGDDDTPGVRLLRAKPGTGKTHAMRELVKRQAREEREKLVQRHADNGGRALVLLPVHDNISEELTNYRLAGGERWQAARTPQRRYGALDDDQANCWNCEADHAEALGLPAVACVCNCGCPLRERCEASGYLAGLNEAKAAAVLIATHKRGEVMGLELLAEGRDLLVADEDSRQLLKPMVKASIDDVRDARADLAEALDNPRILNSDWLNETKDDSESAKEKKAELEAFLRYSLPAIDNLVQQAEGAETTKALDVQQWGGRVPPKLLPFVFHKLSGNRKWANGSPWSALSWALTEGAVYVTDHESFAKKAADKKATERWLVSVRSNPLPAGASVWIADGTASKEGLEQLLGVPVRDLTPRATILRQHRAVQYLRDVTRQTEPAEVVKLLRGFLESHPEVEELGVICHRPHFRTLEDLHEPRLKRLTYFGAGDERMSNAWHQQCDAVLIIGTPRPGADAVRLELLRIGDVKAASLKEPPWERVVFEIPNERGESEFCEGGQYEHPAWRAAFNTLCRSELVQCIGRGRAEALDGVPVYVISTEPSGLPAADAPPATINEVSAATLNVLQAWRDSELRPNSYYLGTSSESPDAPLLRTGQVRLLVCKQLGRQVSVRIINKYLRLHELAGRVLRRGNAGWMIVPKPAKPEPEPTAAKLVATGAVEVFHEPKTVLSAAFETKSTRQDRLGSTLPTLPDGYHSVKPAGELVPPWP